MMAFEQPPPHHTATNSFSERRWSHCKIVPTSKGRRDEQSSPTSMTVSLPAQPNSPSTTSFAALRLALYNSGRTKREYLCFSWTPSADPAQKFFLTHCSSLMPLEQIAMAILRHFNSEIGKLHLQSEMDSLDLASYMRKKNCMKPSEGLASIVNHINALTLQLPHGFGDDPHEKRYFRRSVMCFDWAQNPIAQLNTSRYMVTQFTPHWMKALSWKKSCPAPVRVKLDVNNTQTIT